jgi:hypothetical protein
MLLSDEGESYIFATTWSTRHLTTDSRKSQVRKEKLFFSQPVINLLPILLCGKHIPQAFIEVGLRTTMLNVLFGQSSLDRRHTYLRKLFDYSIEKLCYARVVFFVISQPKWKNGIECCKLIINARTITIVDNCRRGLEAQL